MKISKRNKAILGYHPSTLSLFKSGKRPVSWPLAEKLANIFPEKSIGEWKRAPLEKIQSALEQAGVENKTKKAHEKHDQER